jgi:hypothetical protein
MPPTSDETVVPMTGGYAWLLIVVTLMLPTDVLPDATVRPLLIVVAPVVRVPRDVLPPETVRPLLNVAELPDIEPTDVLPDATVRPLLIVAPPERLVALGTVRLLFIVTVVLKMVWVLLIVLLPPESVDGAPGWGG